MGYRSTFYNIHMMNWTLQQLAWLEEDREREAQKKAAHIKANQDKFGDALQMLRFSDPQGWVGWYDDDSNIPRKITWTDDVQVACLCQRMLARAAAVGGRWRMASGTLYRGVIVWVVGDGALIFENGNDGKYLLFDNLEQAKAFIDSLAPGDIAAGGAM